MYWPVMIMTAEMAGQDSGTITCRMILRWPAPSMRAASSRSRGMVRKCWRSRKMPDHLDERRDDQAELGVQQVQVLDDDELGDGGDLAGQRERGQEQGEQDLPAAELQPREGVGGQHADDGRADDDRGGDHHRVQDVDAERRRGEQGPVAGQGQVAREPHRGQGRLVLGVLEGLQHDPHHGQEHDDARDGQEQAEQNARRRARGAARGAATAAARTAPTPDAAGPDPGRRQARRAHSAPTSWPADP